MALSWNDLISTKNLLESMSEEYAEHNPATARMAWNLSRKMEAEIELLEEASK